MRYFTPFCSAHPRIQFSMCNTWKSPKFSRSQIFNPGTKFTEPDVEIENLAKGPDFQTWYKIHGSRGRKNENLEPFVRWNVGTLDLFAKICRPRVCNMMRADPVHQGFKILQRYIRLRRLWENQRICIREITLAFSTSANTENQRLYESRLWFKSPTSF
jgi:hypothetical protein